MLLVRIWDRDTGNGTLREDLWYFFLAQCAVELKKYPTISEAKLAAVTAAAEAVWSNRGGKYEKRLWRELDVALLMALLAGVWR